VSVVGARPQFVKLAPVAEAFAEAGVDHVIVHTGQHYDAAMSLVFFEDLRIPVPDVSLGIGSAAHGVQTGAILSAIEPVLQTEAPDWVLVYGDTNSTLAGALAAVKLNLPVAHLEAGLRSFNRRMPEEHNRVLTDHAADLLLAPTQVALRHLQDEGLAARAVVVGDVMVDVCLRVARAVDHVDAATIYGDLRRGQYVAATLHRAENTDEPERLRLLLAALKALPIPVVLPVHPRLRDRAAAAGVGLSGGSVLAIDPLSYPQMVLLASQARAVVTDSGGLQKEAYVLGVPCTTLRTETEWVETLGDGWNVLAPDAAGLDTVAVRERPSSARLPYYGKGRAADEVVAALRAGGASGCQGPWSPNQPGSSMACCRERTRPPRRKPSQGADR
jgi:UDP-N-acetylglucosamine 2-epimerase (non-hydrolysing)